MKSLLGLACFVDLVLRTWKDVRHHQLQRIAISRSMCASRHALTVLVHKSFHAFSPTPRSRCRIAVKKRSKRGCSRAPCWANSARMSGAFSSCVPLMCEAASPYGSCLRQSRHVQFLSFIPQPSSPSWMTTSRLAADVTGDIVFPERDAVDPGSLSESFASRRPDRRLGHGH
jgi:hypothetical protein